MKSIKYLMQQAKERDRLARLKDPDSSDSSTTPQPTTLLTQTQRQKVS